MSQAQNFSPEPGPGQGLIIIPAYNEEHDIAVVIGDIRARCDWPVVVVDDASTDATIEQARAAGAEVLSLPLQLGAWGATQTGIRLACRRRYDFVVTMDADGQHEAAWLDALTRPLREGRADVSIGCYTERGSRSRQFAWKLMRMVSGLALEDLTSGFRVYNRFAMQVLEKPGATLLEFQDVGVLATLVAAGARITEVEVTMLPRRSGISRVFSSWLVVIYYMCLTLLLGFSKRGLKARQV